MQINKTNNATNFNARMSSNFLAEMKKLRERIYQQNGGLTIGMIDDFHESLSGLGQTLRDTVIITSKKGQKGTFLSRGGRIITRLSPKFKKFNLNDLHQISKTLESLNPKAQNTNLTL